MIKDEPGGRALPGGPSGASTARGWTLAVVAAAYVAYLALLVTCDLLRIAPLGFRATFESGSMIVEDVLPGSIASRAGLRLGDRITQANGQIVEGRNDWQRVRLHLDPTRPLELAIERGFRASTVQLSLPSGFREPAAGSPPRGLLTFRLAQVVTLLFAVLVAVRRSSQPSALLGALLLASIATVSLVLPMRMAAFWQALPPPVAALLWVPFATSVAVGPLLFAFFAVFPRRRLSRNRLAIALLPAVTIVAWHVYSGYLVTRAPGEATGLADTTAPIFFVNVLYAACAVAMLLSHRRAAATITEKRRIRVLVVGTVVGVTAGAAAVARYWLHPWEDIFATRTLTVLSLAFLAAPASFAYAILRHRLFDVSLIVRQGVRYALARRLLDALGPMLGALLLADVILHRDQPLLTMLSQRWWWYSLIAAALLVARARREAWLTTLDRHFFRERYDAQRLLVNIAAHIGSAVRFDAVVLSVVQQIEEALHPEFVGVLRQMPGEPFFTHVAGGSSRHPTGPLSSSLTVIGVLSVLRKPLALSRGDTAWVRHQLPLEERTLLVERGIELLVPIAGPVAGDRPAALLVFGARRSEEPYSEEDLELLQTIAHALGRLLERSWVGAQELAECETCGECFDAGTHVCPRDSQRLTAVRGSRLLNGRYRLDRRLGRGGMGAVYAAVDEALERPVAVKVIRDDLVVSLDLNARFRREARAGAAFSHPHVVRVYDFGVDQAGRAFLVMELLAGGTLRQRLASPPPLGAPEVLHILRGVCPAVSAAHRQGLVHRDLKPENIFLERHEGGIVPKVLDFGLAKAFGADWPVERSEITSAGFLVGTLEYMSPEQAAGDVAAPAWDVWALGVMTHEMLTGSHPFRQSLAFAGGQIAVTDDIAGAGSGQSCLSRTAAGFFRSALSTDRSLRPKDALEFLGACEQVLR